MHSSALMVPLVPNHDPYLLMVRSRTIEVYTTVHLGIKDYRGDIQFFEDITDVGYIESGEDGRCWLIIILSNKTIRILGFRTWDDWIILNQFEVRDVFDRFKSSKNLQSGTLTVGQDHEHFAVYSESSQSLHFFKKLEFDTEDIAKLLDPQNTTRPDLFLPAESVQLMPLVYGKDFRLNRWELKVMGSFTSNADMGIMCLYDRYQRSSTNELSEEKKNYIGFFQYSKMKKSTVVTGNQLKISERVYAVVKGFDELGYLYFTPKKVIYKLTPDFTSATLDEGLNENTVRIQGEGVNTTIEKAYLSDENWLISAACNLTEDSRPFVSQRVLLAVSADKFILSEHYLERGYRGVVLKAWDFKELQRHNFGLINYMKILDDYVIYVASEKGFYLIEVIPKLSEWKLLQTLS